MEEQRRWINFGQSSRQSTRKTYPAEESEITRSEELGLNLEKTHDVWRRASTVHPCMHIAIIYLLLGT